MKLARCTLCHITFELSCAGRLAVLDHGKGQKHNDALKKVPDFFKKLLSIKQTTVEGAHAVKVESDNQVPTFSQQHTIESCRYCFDKG